MKHKDSIQLQIVWGIILILAGVLVFYRIPQVMPKLSETYKIFESGIIFLKFCFYFIGVVLIGGGIKKLYDNFGKLKKEKADE